jgi:hypothetical protein
MPDAPAQQHSRRFVMAMTAAALLAAAVRAPFLTDGLWYDEIAAFLGYSINGPWGAVSTYHTQANHVLHSLLAWWSGAVLGVDEVTVRLPSFLAGLGAVLAVAWLAMTALGRDAKSVRLAVTAAFMTALMPIAVLPATEARGYSLMTLFSALMTAAFLRALRGSTPTAWLIYAAACALGIWAHLVTVCVPAFHAAWCAVVLLRGASSTPSGTSPKAARAGLIAIGMAALLTLLLYAPILPALFGIRNEFRALDGNEPTLLGIEGLMMLLSLGGSWKVWASLAALPLVVAGIAAAMRDARLRTALLLSLGGVVVALAFPLFLGSWLYARFLAFTVPGIALLLAAGLLEINDRKAIAARVVALLVASAWIASLVTLGPRQQIREAVMYVASHRTPTEGTFAVGLPDDVHQWYAVPLRVDMPGSGPYGSALEQRLGDPAAAWAVLLYPRTLTTAADQLRDAGFVEEARFPGWIDAGGGEIIVLRRR